MRSAESKGESAQPRRLSSAQPTAQRPIRQRPRPDNVLRAQIQLVRTLAALLPLASLALPIACKRTPAESPDAATSAPSSFAITSASAIASASTTALPPNHLWLSAHAADPLELARLADDEGATGLLDALAPTDESGDAAPASSLSEIDRLTAIRALAFVDDPTPALAYLATTAISPPLERSTVALQTLAALAPRRLQIEEDDPSAWRTCADTLSLGLTKIEGAQRRELIIRALLGLAERGAIERSKIPTK